MPHGISHNTRRVAELIEDASVDLPGQFRLLIDRLLKDLRLLCFKAITAES